MKKDYIPNLDPDTIVSKYNSTSSNLPNIKFISLIDEYSWNTDLLSSSCVYTAPSEGLTYNFVIKGLSIGPHSLRAHFKDLSSNEELVSELFSFNFVNKD